MTPGRNRHAAARASIWRNVYRSVVVRIRGVEARHRRAGAVRDRSALDRAVTHGATVCATPLLDGVVVLAVGCIVSGFAARRPDIVALGAIPTVFAVGALLLPRANAPEGILASDSADAAVGEGIALRLDVTATTPLRTGLAVRLPAGLEVSSGSAVVELDLSGSASTHMLRVSGLVPARVHVGPVVAQWHDRFTATRTEAVISAPLELNIVPRADLVRSLLRAADTGAHVGEQVALRRGDGLEFAEVRPLSPGDPLKRINWRASARRDDLLVSARHPDRNRDVVLVLDGQDELVGSDGHSTLHASMHAVAAIASAHLARHDRVGFVGLGNAISWVTPASGVRARHQLLRAISEVTVNEGSVRRSIDVIPERARPARALLVLVSSFLDASSVHSAAELQRRGLDVAAVVVDPFEFATVSPLGRRLWRLDREAITHAVTVAGIPYASWVPSQPIEGVLREVMTWQQRMRSTVRIATR